MNCRVETKQPIDIQHPHLLIVEGEEDKRFFEALIEYMKLTDVQVLAYCGKTNLRKFLRALVASSGFLKLISLGVVRDADENPQAAFQSVCDALKYVGLPTPHKPLEIAGKKPAVTVIILPEPDSPGSLEDLCLKAVADHPAMTCVDKFFECLKKRGLCLPDNMSKAKVQAFLASKHRPLRLGEAAEAGYWPLDHQVFQPVKDIIARLVQ